MEAPIPYRVEYASTNRAQCKGSAACKAEKTKIQKSELRFGTYVENDRIQGWQWRHWGCVTQKVLSNVSQKLDGDYDLLDGLEDLFEEDQEKVKKAILEGEIDKADVTPALLEDIEAKEAEKKAKVAEKEAQQLQKEREKEEKKAQKEREKEEKKAQKEREKEEKKAQKEAAKASKAKKRKREASQTESDEEDAKPASKQKVKQEDDAAPAANSKAKREVAPAKAQPKNKKVKAEVLDPQPNKVKEEEEELPKPKKGRKGKSVTAANLDGATDEAPRTGRGKSKIISKPSAAPTRRSARTKR